MATRPRTPKKVEEKVDVSTKPVETILDTSQLVVPPADIVPEPEPEASDLT